MNNDIYTITDEGYNLILRLYNGGIDFDYSKNFDENMKNCLHLIDTAKYYIYENHDNVDWWSKEDILIHVIMAGEYSNLMIDPFLRYVEEKYNEDIYSFGKHKFVIHCSPSYKYIHFDPTYIPILEFNDSKKTLIESTKRSQFFIYELDNDYIVNSKETLSYDSETKRNEILKFLEEQENEK